MNNLTHNSFLCIYFSSLHVSSNLVLIIRRINCINTTSGICHYVSVTVSCAGRKGKLSNKYYVFWVNVCGLTYPACNAHAPYFHLWPVWLYNTFPHYLIKGTVFVKQLLNMKCVLWISLQLLFEIFLILRRNEREMTKNIHSSSCTVSVIFVWF
jgi:hypothetical protein